MTGEALKSEKTSIYLFAMHSYSYYILLHPICFCVHIYYILLHIYRKNSSDLT